VIRRVFARFLVCGLVVLSSGWFCVDGPRAYTADYSDWLVSFEDVVTPPVARSQVDQVIDAGVIETDGFSHVVLCIGGEMKSKPTRAGKIGVVLVPDIYPFDKVLELEGRYLFAIEATAEAGPDDNALFESEQIRAPVAFPRYRAYVYNGTDAAAGVWIYAYRTRGN
jgi:hypothetical protein